MLEGISSTQATIFALPVVSFFIWACVVQVIYTFSNHTNGGQ